MHIMLLCVFAKDVWNKVCLALRKPDWIPSDEATLIDWCRDKEGRHLRKKDLRALMILVMWELRKHRNGIVFEGDSPSVGL